MPIKNLTLGACLLLAATALAQNHHNTHIVRKGESLSQIAKWTGVSKAKLVAVNNLTGKKLRPGLVLRVPSNSIPPGFAPYTIHPHDSDGKIARMYRMDPQILRNMNASVNWHAPRVGTTIKIPMHKAVVYARLHQNTVAKHEAAGAPHYNLALGGYAPYTVRRHDSDWKIANMFHMASSTIRELNPSVAWGSPRAGTIIRIPMRNAFIYKLARIPVLRSRYAVTLRSQTVVRSAPGSNAHRVTVVDANRHVAVLDRDDHWYKVRFEQGTTGWIRGDLLQAEQPKIYAHHEPAHHSSERLAHVSRRHRATDSENRRFGRSAGAAPDLPQGGGDVIAYAESYRGTPYRWGRNSRSGTDCSGLTLQVMRHEGVRLPRTAAEQARKGEHVGKASLKAGDLVFFRTSGGRRISHVGIYMGNDKFIHASSGGGRVQVNSLSDKYYKRRFATARRVAKLKKHELAVVKHEDSVAMHKAEKDIQTGSRGVDTIDK